MLCSCLLPISLGIHCIDDGTSRGKLGACVIDGCGHPVFAAFFMAVISRFQMPSSMPTRYTAGGAGCRTH